MAKAMALARRGKWRDAEVAITDGSSDLSDPVALHAVAALVTSEGDYVRALKLWEQLLSLDPNHEEARRMVPAIELWLSRPGWTAYFPYIAGGVATVIIGLFLYFALAGPAYVPVQHHSIPTVVSPVETTAAAPQNVAAPTPIPVVSFPTASSSTAKRHR